MNIELQKQKALLQWELKTCKECVKQFETKPEQPLGGRVYGSREERQGDVCVFSFVTRDEMVLGRGLIRASGHPRPIATTLGCGASVILGRDPVNIYPVLPGPEDRIVDFPEGKIGWMSFSKRLGRYTPQCYTKPLDSLKNWNKRFFWVNERVFPTVVDWRTNVPKDGMPAVGTYSLEAVRVLDTHHMDLFNLICALNLTKVKVGSRPRTPHEGAAALEIPSSKNAPATVASGVGQAEKTATMDPLTASESRKRGHDGTDVNALPKTVGVSDLDPLSFADAPSRHPADIAQSSQ
nr:hypothetical protein [Tanacetum cinerariifolium]